MSKFQSSIFAGFSMRQRAHDNNTSHYDDIFNDTGQRLREQGFATKQDVAVVTFWKAINLSTPWARHFLNTDPRTIRDATRKRFARAWDDDRD